MRVEQLGDGDPTLAIVGAVHGDEPCGARAVDRLLADDPAVERPVKLIVANEDALDRGVRFLEADLNRSFGDDSQDTHEHRLARQLADELRDCTVASLHSTRSHDEPFGIVNGLDGAVSSIAPFLSIVAMIDTDTDEGRPFALEATDLIEIEAGFQGSEQAAENAYRIAREFLTATGVLPGQTVGRDLPVYRMSEPIEKPTATRYEVFVENFVEVDAGETFAAADGEALTAEQSFYPLLMSADGYGSIFGYVGDHVGVLQPPDQERTSP